MSIDDSGSGIIMLSQVFSLKWQPYLGWICHRGRPLDLDSQIEPGLASLAGPRGPSRAIPANFPSFKDFRTCLTLRDPRVSDPRETRKPSRRAVNAKNSPSPDCETRMWTSLFLKAATLARTSWCQSPSTPGLKSWGKCIRMRRLRSHSSTMTAAVFFMMFLNFTAKK